MLTDELSFVSSQTIKKTRFPTWKESFEIPLIQAVNSEQKMAVREGLEITIWDWDRLSHNDFMGQVIRR